MSRRQVIRCDQCNRDENMVNPEWMAQTAVSISSYRPVPGLFGPDMKPRPPDGWFERYAGLQGMRDFCSASCVQAWNKRHEADKDTGFA